MHYILGTFSLAILIAAGFMSLNAKDYKIATDLHARVGLGMFILGMIYIASGLSSLYARLYMDVDWGKSKVVRYVAKVHKFFGIGVMVGMQLAMFTGVTYYSKTYGNEHIGLTLAIISPILFVFGVVVGELNYQLKLRKKKGFFSYDIPSSISREEFDQRISDGEKLLILDDLVLDVKGFEKEHPGGRFMISHNIGRDISKFYHGGYSLEENF